MNLGKTIKKIRLEMGLTQREFASKANISQVFLSEMEKDLKNPSWPTLLIIAQNLEISPLELILDSVDENDIKSGQKANFDKFKSAQSKTLLKKNE